MPSKIAANQGELTRRDDVDWNYFVIEGADLGCLGGCSKLIRKADLSLRDRPAYLILARSRAGSFGRLTGQRPDSLLDHPAVVVAHVNAVGLGL